MDINGKNSRVLLDQKNNIAYPQAIGVIDRRLYYLDPRYDKLERVDVSDGLNPQLIIDNDADLKTFTIFRKRPGNSHFVSFL